MPGCEVSASTKFCHVPPPLRLNCHVPLVWSAAVIAMPWCEPDVSLIGEPPNPARTAETNRPEFDDGFSRIEGKLEFVPASVGAEFGASAIPRNPSGTVAPRATRSVICELAGIEWL